MGGKRTLTSNREKFPLGFCPEAAYDADGSATGNSDRDDLSANFRSNQAAL